MKDNFDHAVIDADSFSVHRTIRIAAPLEKVWRVITAPELIAEWFGQLVLEGDGAGAHGTINWPGEPAVPIRVETIDPPRSIAYRWRNETGLSTMELSEENSTVFTFTLEELPEGTLLTVVETGFDQTREPAERMAGHRSGWDEKLDQLVALLERQS